MKSVAVPLATLWNAPREGTPYDVVTQLLLGDPVAVDEVRDDGWARVVAPDQPAPLLEPRGYPGWLRAEQLTSFVDAPAVVDALRTDLRVAPGGAVAVSGLMLGTRLVPAGPPTGGWLPVQVPGRAEPLWAPQTHVRPGRTGPADPAEALATARRLLGVAYVWGGLSPAGIDCSGLVHLAWRVLGVRLPRDAHEQAAAADPVPPGQERPGDLYFFARPAVRIHHVGIVVAPGRMLHACGRAARVVEEPPDADRTATLTGAFRVRPAA